MIYDWYKIFNQTEFEALNLVSKEYVLNLDGLGEKTIMVTIGHELSIKYDGVFLTLHLNGKNPFEFEDYAVYQDMETNDVYLGILNED